MCWSLTVVQTRVLNEDGIGGIVLGKIQKITAIMGGGQRGRD